jgi:hypothetical protein
VGVGVGVGVSVVGLVGVGRVAWMRVGVAGKVGVAVEMRGGGWATAAVVVRVGGVVVVVVGVGVVAAVVAAAVSGVGVGVGVVGGVRESVRVARIRWDSARPSLHSCTVPDATPSVQAEGMPPASGNDLQGTPALRCGRPVPDMET